jgi:hypothetical protein
MMKELLKEEEEESLKIDDSGKKKRKKTLKFNDTTPKSRRGLIDKNKDLARKIYLKREGLDKKNTIFAERFEINNARLIGKGSFC